MTTVPSRNASRPRMPSSSGRPACRARATSKIPYLCSCRRCAPASSSAEPHSANPTRSPLMRHPTLRPRGLQPIRCATAGATSVRPAPVSKSIRSGAPPSRTSIVRRRPTYGSSASTAPCSRDGRVGLHPVSATSAVAQATSAIDGSQALGLLRRLTAWPVVGLSRAVRLPACSRCHPAPVAWASRFGP